MSSLQDLKVAVFGAGSIGCYLGGYLMAAGVQVTFIGRERVKWDLEMKGLTLTHYKRPTIHISKDYISYSLDYNALADADIILVCVKSQDSYSAGQTIAQYARPDAVLVSFQNGVSNAQTLEESSGRSTVAAIVPFNVTPSARGTFHCGTEGDLILAASKNALVKTLVKAFRKSGMGLITTPDILSYQWGKLLVNLNNALSALSGGTLREGLSQKSYRRVLAAMMEEGLQVCNGAGIKPKSFGKASVEKTLKILRLPNMLFTPVMNKVIKIDPRARSSMLDDLEGGRGSEVEYLQGEIVRLASATGQYAPINAIIREQVLSAFKVHQSPQMSGDDMLALLEGTLN